jgi:hypothetical protein
MVLVGIGLLGAIPVLAGSVFVSDLFSGNVVEVDELGTKTLFASGLGRPGALKVIVQGVSTVRSRRHLDVGH